MYVHSTKLDNTSLSFMDGPALSSSVACRLVLTKLLSANGDGEIRTLDPLLARQVLSQLSYTPMMTWHPPALPCRLQHSTIGRLGLNHRVRDGNGCCPQTHRHQKARVLSEVFPSFRTKLCSSVSARSFRAVSPKNFLFDSP